MSTKRKTKAQREAEQIAALRQRLEDLAAGAQGCAVDTDPDMFIGIPSTLCVEAFCRFLTAVKWVLLNDELRHIVGCHNIDEYTTFEHLAEWMHSHGVRA